MLRSLDDRNKFQKHKIVLAEKINDYYSPDSPYKNLIDLETDIARLSDSVVLFSEGYGSLAELGAFSQNNTIAERMIILIQSHHYNQKSFIKEGPIRYLENRDVKSVQAFNWQVTTKDGQTGIDELSIAAELNDIKKAISDRLSAVTKQAKIDPNDLGHKHILINAICDVLGAATFEDFKDAFDKLGISITDTEIQRGLFCSRVVDWMRFEKRGHTKYYLPVFSTKPCDFSYKPEAEDKDILRWKWEIRDYWLKNDKTRAKLISDFPREEADDE